MSESNTFLGDGESLEELISQMPEPELAIYRKYGHRWFESTFEDRLLIVYEDKGLHANKRYRDPEIITTIKVLGYECDHRKGSRVRITDLTTGAEQTIGHVPARVFDYEVFASVPPFMRLRWDGRPHEGKVKRSLSFALLLKTRNMPDYHSSGNTYMQPPNKLRKLYPDFDLHLRYA